MNLQHGHRKDQNPDEATQVPPTTSTYVDRSSTGFVPRIDVGATRIAAVAIGKMEVT